MKRKHKILLTLGAIAVAIPLVFLLAVGIWIDLGSRPTRTVEDVRWLPSSAEVLFFKDTHGGWHGDGSTLLVFTCTPSDLRSVLSRFAIGDRVPANPPLDKLTRDRFLHLARVRGLPQELYPDLDAPSIRWISGTIIADTATCRLYFMEITT